MEFFGAILFSGTTNIYYTQIWFILIHALKNKNLIRHTLYISIGSKGALEMSIGPCIWFILIHALKNKNLIRHTLYISIGSKGALEMSIGPCI